MQSVNYRLSKLEIDNFRQYRKVRIEFSQDPEKMFTIIKGDNGFGKTNIMNAITWCLYGKEKHLSQTDKDLPIVNGEVLKGKLDGIVNTRVKIVLADIDGDKAIIERNLRLYINGESTRTTQDSEYKILIPDNSTPHVTKLFQIHKDGGWERTTYFDKSVNDLLPEDLATYFLFDGEKLESFFEHRDDAKKGIEDVSQVKLIGESMDTLSKFITKLRKGVKGGPMLQQTQDEFALEKENLDDVRKYIKKLKQKYVNRQKELSDVEQSMSSIDGNVGKYQKDAIMLKGEIQNLKEKLKDAKTNMSNIILDNKYKLDMIHEVKKTYELILQKSKEGELPPNIKDTFLNEILKRNLCICGRDISPGTTSREKVNALVKKAHYSSIEELCTELKYELNPMLDTNKIIDDLIKSEKIVHGYEEKIDDLKKMHKDLEAKIGEDDIDEVQRFQERKKKLQEDVLNISSELGQHRQKEKDLSDKVDSLGRKIDKEAEVVKKHNHLWKKIQFCKNAHTGLKRTNDELLNDVRNKVQAYTKKYFLEFLWKKNTYDDVVIDDNYDITARHVDGYEVRGGLAAGEKLALALSFMAALRKITGFGFPLIIDTPLGRVSGGPRHNIARALPAFLKDTQVTMLVTNTEYDAEIHDEREGEIFPPVRETLNKHVGIHYKLIFDSGQTKVEVS